MGLQKMIQTALKLMFRLLVDKIDYLLVLTLQVHTQLLTSIMLLEMVDFILVVLHQLLNYISQTDHYVLKIAD